MPLACSPELAEALSSSGGLPAYHVAHPGLDWEQRFSNTGSGDSIEDRDLSRLILAAVVKGIVENIRYMADQLIAAGRDAHAPDDY